MEQMVEFQFTGTPEALFTTVWFTAVTEQMEWARFVNEKVFKKEER